MREPCRVPRLVVEVVHFDQLREHGGMPGLRHDDALEAVLARPRQKWHYGKELDATEPELVQVMTALAAGSLKKPQLAAWVRDHLVRLSL